MDQFINGSFNPKDIDFYFCLNDSVDDTKDILFEIKDLDIFNSVIIDEYQWGTFKDDRNGRFRPYFAMVKAFNLCFDYGANSDSDFVLFMGSDTLINLDTLKKGVEKNEDVYFPLLYTDTQFCARDGKQIRKHHVYKEMGNSIQDYIPEQSGYVDYVSGMFLFKRKVLKNNKIRFDVRTYNDGDHEYRFCKKIRDAGYKIYCDVDNVCEHLIAKR